MIGASFLWYATWSLHLRSSAKRAGNYRTDIVFTALRVSRSSMLCTSVGLAVKRCYSRSIISNKWDGIGLRDQIWLHTRNSVRLLSARSRKRPSIVSILLGAVGSQQLNFPSEAGHCAVENMGFVESTAQSRCALPLEKPTVDWLKPTIVPRMKFAVALMAASVNWPPGEVQWLFCSANIVQREGLAFSCLIERYNTLALFSWM